MSLKSAKDVAHVLRVGAKLNTIRLRRASCKYASDSHSLSDTTDSERTGRLSVPGSGPSRPTTAALLGAASLSRDLWRPWRRGHGHQIRRNEHRHGCFDRPAHGVPYIELNSQATARAHTNAYADPHESTSRRAFHIDEALSCPFPLPGLGGEDDRDWAAGKEMQPASDDEFEEFEVGYSRFMFLDTSLIIAMLTYFPFLFIIVVL